MADKLFVLIRFVALVVDVLVLTLIGWPVKKFLLSGFLHDLNGDLFDIVLFITYRVVMHGIYGQTIGKRIWNLKVMDIRGLKKIGLFQAMSREIIPCLILLMPYLSLKMGIDMVYDQVFGYWVTIGLKIVGIILLLADIILMFNNQLKRTLHDILAKSVVVNAGALETDELKKTLNQ
jgi:uncharacterized RDD family membrane protein YckC